MARGQSRRSRCDRAAGFSLLEAVLATAIAATLLAFALPASATVVDGSRARQAAGDLAARFRLARQRAAAEGVAVAVVFDRNADTWVTRMCRDGNGNGVRRAELGSTDPCEEDQGTLEDRFPGVTLALDADVPDAGGDFGNADPVRFGAGDLASFAPLGTATAGTVYLRSAGTHYAVRVAGLNGRTRILRWTPAVDAWLAQ